MSTSSRISLTARRRIAITRSRIDLTTIALTTRSRITIITRRHLGFIKMYALVVMPHNCLLASAQVTPVGKIAFAPVKQPAA